MRKSSLLLAKARLCIGLVFERELAHKDFAIFANNYAKIILLAHLAKRHVLRTGNRFRRGKRACHFISQVHRPESGIRSKEQVRISDNRPHQSSTHCRSSNNRFLQIHIILHRDASVKRRAHQMLLVQRINAFAIACKPDKRSIAWANTIKRNLHCLILFRNLLLHYRRVRHEQRIAKSIHRLERSIFRSKHNRLARFIIFVIDKYGTAHSIRKSHILRELRLFNASIVNANRYANDWCSKVNHAITHERICGPFDASILRNFHRNLDSRIATMRRRGIRITRRHNRISCIWIIHRHDGLDCIKLLESIMLFVFGITQMREQVRSATKIVGIFAKSILERLANTQDAIGFHKRKPKLMVAKFISTPIVCNSVLERFTQIPIVHFPHGDTACRKPRIKTAHAKHKPLRLILVGLALTLDTDFIFEYRRKTIDNNFPLHCRIITLRRLAEIHFHHPVLSPGTLTVFNQDVFTSTQSDLHDFGPETATRRRNINRHRMPRRRAHFLNIRPAHVGAFPCGREHREEPVARIVACKVHHVEIAQAGNSLSSIVSVRHSQFTANLVHHKTVDTPVQPVLRCRFAHHHNRLERINRGTLQHKPVIQRIVRNRNFRKAFGQISPKNARDKTVPEIARSVGPLRSHAATINKTACTGMRNHERALCIRIFRKRNIERRILRAMSLHHDIVHKTQVIASAG